MNAMDLLVQNSTVEPLGLAIMEGLATGTPAVASGVDGVREVIDPEVNGLLAAPGDLDDLAANLERLIADTGLRRRLAADARQTMLRKFSLSQQMSLIHALYREAIDNLGTHPATTRVTGATAK
jgi:glycosyltransferase involved in cell wall biosynthesis